MDGAGKMTQQNILVFITGLLWAQLFGSWRVGEETRALER